MTEAVLLLAACEFTIGITVGYCIAGNLNLGGPAPIGARKANLSNAVEPYLQEVALSEQVITKSCNTSFMS